MEKTRYAKKNWLTGIALMMGLILSFSFTSFSQEKIVTGIVTSAEDGLGIPGVSVSIEGTAIGTITDIDGNYSLSIPENAKTLVFSFVGMTTQKLAVQGRLTINVTMENEITQVSEVVVTALGIKKERKKLGYAVTEVQGKEISELATVNPVDALQGKVAGVEIDMTTGGSFGGTRITIRGNATLTGNNQPIFVIDGLVVDNLTSGGSQWGSMDWGNELKNLNTDDFESISILKGAAATALYGSRALNGVVVVTTKKGSKSRGLGVEVMHTSTFEIPYGGLDFQNEFGAGWDYMTKDADQYLGMTANSDGTYTPISYVYSFGPKMEGQAIKLPDGTMTTYSPHPNNFLDSYETGVFHDTNVAISGGGEKSTFRLSYSNTEKQGIAIKNDFSKSNVALRMTHELSDRLSIDAGVSIAKSEGTNPPRGGSFNSHNIGRKFYYQFPRNYDTKFYQNHYKDEETGARLDAAKFRGSDLWFNLYEQLYVRDEQSIKANMKVTAKVTDWFDFRVEGYYNMYNTKMEEKNRSTTGTGSDGYYGLEHNSQDQYTVKLFANFNKTFGDFDLSGSAIAETWKTENAWTKANTRGGFVDAGIFNLSNSKETPAEGQGGINGEKQINSLYGFADIGWKDQLFLSITARNDWSSTLTYADGSGNNSYFYPSVSASWLYSETFDLPEWIDYGQFRSSWAQVGNDTSPYTLTTGYKKQGIDFVDMNGGSSLFYTYNSNIVPNLDLQPEKQTSVEFGTNVVMFKNRVNLDFNYYKSNTRNQILDTGVPSESGVGSQKVNSGDLENKGVEIQLGITPIRSTDFSWEATFTYSTNKNTLNELIDGMEYTDLASGLDVTSRAYAGEEYGGLYTRYAYTRYQHKDASGNNVDNASNGKYVLKSDGFYKRAGVDTKVGNAMADWRAGFSNTIRYKNLSLNFSINAKIGGDLVSSAHQYGTMGGTLALTLPGRDEEHGGVVWTSSDGETYQDGILPEGVFNFGEVINGQDVSGMTYAQAYEQGLVEPMHAIDYYDGLGGWGAGIREYSVLENSYVSLRNVRLTYALPKNYIRKIGLQKLELSVFGTDLGYLYNSLPAGLNPNSILTNQPGVAFEYNGAPLSRTFGFSLKAGF